MLVHNKKCLKRPFRGVLAKKVTSTTPLNIGFYIGINEFFGDGGHFLLNKSKNPSDFPPPQYIRLLHKLQMGGALNFFIGAGKISLGINFWGAKPLSIKSWGRKSDIFFNLEQ